MDALRKLLVVAILGGGGYGYYYTQVKSGRGTPLGMAAFSGSGRGSISGNADAGGEGFEDLKSQGLDQVLRFDVKPGWVLANWQRVTTGLSDVGLQGYRVVLVTGTGESDLAGSLTYYFDNVQRVRRIAFVGATGDYTPLVTFLEQRYGLRRQVTSDARIVTYAVPRPKVRLPGVGRKQPSEGRSQLRITPAAVVSRHNPNARFEIDLTLEAGGTPVVEGAAPRSAMREN
jgi:hypothetical protein